MAPLPMRLVPGSAPATLCAMSDNVIQFPGAPGDGDGEDRVSEPGSGVLGMAGLSADQEKAVQLVLSGKSFVCVAIEPTGTGADFFTAIDGLAQELGDAKPHLGGVVERALDKRGI